MSKVKDLLKDNKRFSDAGATDDDPPTPKDAELREKHVSDSIPYNTAHAFDHLEQLCNQAEKLRTINKPLATKLIKQSLKKLNPLLERMEKL